MQQYQWLSTSPPRQTHLVDRFQCRLVEILVLKHFHMNRENRRRFTAFCLPNQGAKLAIGVVNGLVETLNLLFAVYGGLFVSEFGLAHNEGRRQGQSR